MANLYITGSTAVTTISLAVGGVPTNFDSTPSCTLVAPNKTTVLATATVSLTSTGLYSAIFTVPDSIVTQVEYIEASGLVATKPMKMRVPITASYAEPSWTAT